MGSHRSRARALVSRAGAPCGLGVLEVRPSLLVLNDLETEITPRLPFERLLAA